MPTQARLRTLGALELTGADGHSVDAIHARQRRLALLVYVAVEGGWVRRETLLGVFWPDLDQARARAALRQSVYVLRREVGDDIMVTRGADEVSAGAVDCDAVQFLSLAREGRHADALALYAGPFLHGFYIPGAPDFERWVDEQRDTLKRQACACERQLAADAESRGDAATATAHLRRLLALEPTDESTLRALMRQLDAAGDRAAALREYDDFVQSLRREFEIDPSPDTAREAARLRETPFSALGSPLSALGSRLSADSSRLSADSSRLSALGSRLSASGHRTAESGHRTAESGQRTAESGQRTAESGLRAAESGQRTAESGQRTAESGQRLRLPWFAAIMALLLVVAATIARSMNQAGDTLPRLAVLPFAVRGSEDIAYLGEGMADMLSTSLDGPELYRTVSPSVVTREARARRLRGGESDDARSVAQRFDAGQFVTGTVFGIENRIRVDARLYGEGADPVASTTVEGDQDSIFTIVDRVAAQLIAQSRGRGPAERLRGSAALTTRSLQALRDYLSGERALRDGAYGGALEFFRRAVGADTSFALAYYRMSMAAEWLGDQRQALALAGLANSRSARLSERDRALLAAHNTMLRGHDVEAERQYRAILDDSPDDVEAWLKVGEILFHNNPRRGQPQSEARAPFMRVLSYDRENRAALLHLTRLAAAAGDVAELDSLAARLLGLANIGDQAFGVRVVQAAARHDRRAIEALRAAGASVSEEMLTDAARDAYVYAGDAEIAQVIFGLALSPARSRERRLLTRLQLGALELSRGRRHAADSQFVLARAVDDFGVAPLFHAFFSVHGDLPLSPRKLRDWSARLSQLSAADRVPRLPLLASAVALYPQIRDALLGSIALQLGDTATAARLTREIAAANVEPRYVGLRDVIRSELEDEMSSAAHAPTPDSARVTRETLLVGTYAFPWHAAARFARGEALVRAGDLRGALPHFTSFEHQGIFHHPFLARGALRAAEIHDRLGEATQAAALRASVARRWKDAEPVMR